MGSKLAGIPRVALNYAATRRGDIEWEGVLMLRSRRLAVLGSVCSLLITGAAPAFAAGLGPLGPSAGPAALAVPTEELRAAPVVIATYNVRHGLSDDVAVSDIERLADAGVGVIALQEMGSWDRRQAVRQQLVDCDLCEFNTFMPTGAGPGELPILYRSANFDLLSKGMLKVSDATYVGPSGAGPSTIAPKYLTYVQLNHRATGQDMYVINSHAVASVQAADGGPNYEHPERLQLYRQHMDGLKAMIAEFKATGAAVFTTGDFNVNYRRDSVLRPQLFPYFNMSQVGVFASYKFLGMPADGTHVGKSGTNDSRLIDYVSSVNHAAVAAKAQTILTGYSSDHRPVRVRYAIATIPGAPTNVYAEPRERSAVVSWAPAPDNGSAVTAYTVTAAPGGAETTVAGDATSATFAGLTSDNSYTFTVRATNSLGTGPDSVASNLVTPFVVLPQTTITTGPANGTFVTSTRATVGYSSSEPGSSFACTLDGVERACGSSSVSMSSLAQTTHLFSVGARDGDGDVDASPATRRWTVPMDNTALTHSSGWSRETGAGYYLGTYSETTKRYAELSTHVSEVRKLALVTTTGPGHGAVKVYLGSTLLKRLFLDSSALTKRQVLPVARFSTAMTGNVRVVVRSVGKTVRVEGLGVATRP